MSSDATVAQQFLIALNPFLKGVVPSIALLIGTIGVGTYYRNARANDIIITAWAVLWYTVIAHISFVAEMLDTRSALVVYKYTSLQHTPIMQG